MRQAVVKKTLALLVILFMNVSMISGFVGINLQDSYAAEIQNVEDNIFTDPLDDFQKVYSKTSNWLFKVDAATPEDTSRIYRSANTPANIIYKSEKPISGYEIKVYNLMELNETLQVYLSKDGEEWIKMEKKTRAEEAAVSNWYWTFVTPAENITTEAFYLKVEALNDTRAYNPQISNVEIYTGGLKARPQQFGPVTQATDTVDSSRYSEAIKVLQGCGILQRDPGKEDVKLDENVKRSEFAHFITGMLGLEDAAGTVAKSGSLYTDVPTKHPEFGDVVIVSNLGIMKGYADGTFRPDDDISFEQVLHVLVRALGYDVVAKNKGGDSNAYALVARDLEITKNVDIKLDEAVTREQAAQLIFNTLKARPATVDDKGKLTVSDKDVMSGNLKITKRNGQITGTWYGSIAGTKSIKKDEITIDTLVFRTHDERIQDLLGYNITYYTKDDEDDRHLLIAYEITRDKNTPVKVEADKIMADSGKFTVTQFVYENEDGQEETKEMDIRYMVKNGMRKMDVGVEDFALKSGHLTLLDADGDNSYETVVIEEYHPYIAESIDQANHKIISRYNNEELILDVENEDNIIILKDGKPTDFNSIKKKDVLSVARSEDGSYTKVIITGGKLSGTIEEAGEEENQVLIDGRKYGISLIYKEWLNHHTAGAIPLEIGLEGEFYMDADGKIIGADVYVSANQYAYLMEASVASSVNGQLQVKLFGADGGFEIFDCIPKVTIDDGVNRVKYDGQEAYSRISYTTVENGKEVRKTKDQLIRYDLNADHKIRCIYLAKEGYDESVFSMNYKDTKAFSNVNGMDIIAFRYSVAKSKAFVIPSDRDSLWEYKNTYKFIEGDMRTSSTDPKYSVEVFDSDSMNQAKALVIYKDAAEGTVQSGIMNTPLAVVQKITRVYDEKSEKYMTKIYFVYKKQEVSYLASETLLVESAPEGESGAEKLKIGDIVQMGFDSEGRIAKMLMFYKADRNIFNLGATRVVGFGENNTQSSDIFCIYGNVANVSNAYIMIDVGLGTGVRMMNLKSVSVAIYDSNNKTVKAGTIADIIKGDRVIARSSKAVASDVVIVR